MSWSEAQEGKKKIKQIVNKINPSVKCEIFEPIGEDFISELYPVILKKGRVKKEFKLPMEDLEDIVNNTKVMKKIELIILNEISVF